jgi:threonine dehydrogenase-like Zn-dependent dehydrogenase
LTDDTIVSDDFGNKGEKEQPMTTHHGTHPRPVIIVGAGPVGLGGNTMLLLAAVHNIISIGSEPC